jgi:threonine/homoserine/homoserine lactone efflux protein
VRLLFVMASLRLHSYALSAGRSVKRLRYEEPKQRLEPKSGTAMMTVNDTQKHGCAPMKGSLSRFFNPNIVTFLLAILPQFDGSPSLQVLLLSLLSIVSGTTVNLLKTTVGARARDCLLARQLLCEGFRRAFGAVLGRLTGLHGQSGQ